MAARARISTRELLRRRRRRKAAIALGVVIVASASVGVGVVIRRGAQARAIAESRREGMRLFEAGDHAAALPKLGWYVARIKDDGEALLAYAESCAQVPRPNGRHLKQTVDAARLAESLLPDDIRPLELLISAYTAMNYRSELRDACDRAIAIDPTFEQAHAALVRLRVAASDAGAAMAAAEAFVAACPNAFEAYRSLSLAMDANDAGPQALLAMWRRDDAVAACSSVATYHVQLARLLAATGDPDGAIASALRAAEVPPRDAEEASAIVTWLGVLAAELRSPRVENAGRGLRDALLTSGVFGARVAADASIAAWWRGDDDEALAMARRIDTGSAETPMSAIGWRALLAAISDADLDCVGCDERIAADPAWKHLIERATGDSTARPELLNDPGIPTAIERYFQARSLLRMGDTAAAEVALQPLVVGTKTPFARAMAAQIELLLDAGDPVQAWAFLPRLRSAGAAPPLYQSAEFRCVSSIMAEGGDPALSLASVLLASMESDDKPRADEAVNTVILRVLALHTVGRGSEAAEAARALLARLGSVEANAAILLSSVFKDVDPSLAMELLDAVQRPDPRVARDSAILLGGEAGVALFDASVPADRTGDEAWAVARVQLLETMDHPSEPEATRSLSDTFLSSAGAQIVVLASDVAWSDTEIVRAAIIRLRKGTGETGVAWRVYQARLDLLDTETMTRIDQERRLAAMLVSLQTVLDVSPGNTAAAYYASIAHDKLGAPERAATVLGRAIAAGADASLFPPLIRSQVAADRLGEAQQSLAAFCELDGLPAALLRERAMIRRGFEDPVGAADDLRMLADRGDVSDLAAFGSAAVAAGLVAEARSAADRLIAQGARADAAVLLAAMDDDDAATALLRPSGEDRAQDAERVARSLVARGQIDRCIKWFGIAFNAAPTPRRAMALAYGLAESNQLQQASGVIAAFATRSDDARLGLVADTLGRPPGADAPATFAARGLLLSAASDTAVDDAIGDISEAWLRDQAGADALLDRLADLSRTHPRHVPLWKLRVGALAANVGTDPTQRARLLELLGEAADALPTEAWPLTALAEMHLADERLDEAEDAIDRVRRLAGPRSMAVDAVRARVAFARGDATGVIAALTPHEASLFGTGASPTDDLARLHIAMLAAEGRFAVIERLIDPLVAADPAWASLLVLAAENGAPREALRWRAMLQRAESVIGDRQPANRGIAWLALAERTGDTDDAVRAATRFKAAVDAGDQDIGTRLQLARAMELSGDAEAALGVYLRILDESPNLIIAINNAAYLLVDALDRPGEAVPLAQRAVIEADRLEGAESIQASARHTLFLALRDVGNQNNQALRYIREAFALRPGAPRLAVDCAAYEIFHGSRKAASEILAGLDRRSASLPPDIAAQVKSLINNAAP